MKYRKKPAVIEAFQWTDKNSKNIKSWPGWLYVNYTPNFKPYDKKRNSFYEFKGNFYIYTLEGEHQVSENDWIIKGVKDELYPCKPDIFKETYEEVR